MGNLPLMVTESLILYAKYTFIVRIWATAWISDAAQIWLIPLNTVFNVSRFYPALNWNRLLKFIKFEHMNSNTKNLSLDIDTI